LSEPREEPDWPWHALALLCNQRFQERKLDFEELNTMADRPSSPSPEEREKLDKEAKQKENEEQSKLPYKWTQQIGDLDLTSPIPSNIKGKDLDVKITKTSIKAAIKGQDAIIEVHYLNAIPVPA
jgi:hypothetical protein